MDFSKPTLLISAFVSAFLVGLFSTGTAGATHQNLYQGTMTPPTHAIGQLSFNSCGWHFGDCRNNQNGNSLDWGYWNGAQADYNVRFRGWLYRSNTAYSNGYLMLNVFQGPIEPNVCDEAIADVIEIAPWRVRYGMHYTHSDISVGGGVGLYVSGSGYGAWNNPTVAYMVYDADFCPWTAYHAHTQLIVVALSYYGENRTVYPCCNYGGSNHANNTEQDRTHLVQFQQGH